MEERFDPDTGEVLPPRLDEHGREIPDPRPLRVPAGFRRPETLAEQVQRLVRGAISRQAAEEGYETFEDAEDFDVGDQEDPTTPYETYFDPVLGKELTPYEFKQHQDRYRRDYIEAQRRYFTELDRQGELFRPRSRRKPPAARSPSSDAPTVEEGEPTTEG